MCCRRCFAACGKAALENVFTCLRARAQARCPAGVARRARTPQGTSPRAEVQPPQFRHALALSHLDTARPGRHDGKCCEQPGQHLEAGLLITSWAALLWGLFLAQGWLGIPHRSHDAVALWQLPISDADIFVRERDKLVRSSLFALLDMAACLGAIGLVRHFSAGEWAVVILAAIFDVGISLGRVGTGGGTGARLPLGVAGVWLFNMVVGVILFVVFFGKVSILPYLDRVAPTANLLIPTSWPLGLLGLTDSHPAWSRALLLLPVITVLLSWRDSLRVLAGAAFIASLQFRTRPRSCRVRTMPPRPRRRPERRAGLE